MISKQNKKILFIIIAVWVMIGVTTFTLAAKSDDDLSNENETL